MKKKIVEGFWTYSGKKNLLLNLVLFLLYFFFGKFGLAFASVNPSATVLWAPTGIALASLLIFGKRVIPAILVGAFFVNLTTAGTIITSFGIALGNTLEGIAGAYLVKRFANGRNAFDSVTNIFKFVFFAALVSTALSANIGVITLYLGHLTTIQQVWPVWVTWWMGDMGGNLVIAPLILVWATHPKIRFSYRGILHLLVVIAAMIIVTNIVFSGLLPYPYLCIPLAVWIAFWFGRRGATVTTLLVAVIAIADTLSGLGPFGKNMLRTSSLLLLQTFLSIFSVTSLTFATMVLEARKGEKRIASQEKRFKALIEKSFDAVVLIDTTSKIIYASPTFEKVVGYSPDEIEGTEGFSLVYPEDRPAIVKELSKLVLHPGGTVTVEYRTVRKDGKIIWVEATGTNLLLDADINAIVVNFHDITERKIAAQKMLQEKKEDEAMLGSIGDGVIAVDNMGKITMINERACEMLGYLEKDVLDKNVADALPLENEEGKSVKIADRPISKVLSLGKKIVTDSTMYYVKKDTSRFPVHFTVSPIIMNKQVVGAIEVFQDITREKEVDKAKTEFVSLASHQLRTPLATINWYLEELIKNGTNLSDKQNKYLKEVYEASRRMVELINALLNTSRLELGTFVVEPKQVSLSDIMVQIKKDLASKIEGKAVIIHEDYAKDLPQMPADPKLLTIIIQNLLANSIKYTKDKDTIDIVCGFDKKGFRITLHDNGFGIPKKQQEKIFTKLFRADNARVMVPEGSGLGLYIVKSIVTVTGGDIRFESEENKGTTFFVTYPPTGMKARQGEKALI